MVFTKSTEPLIDCAPELHSTGPVVCVPATYGVGFATLPTKAPVDGDATEKVRKSPVMDSLSRMPAVVLLSVPDAICPARPRWSGRVL